MDVQAELERMKTENSLEARQQSVRERAADLERRGRTARLEARAQEIRETYEPLVAALKAGLPKSAVIPCQAVVEGDAVAVKLGTLETVVREGDDLDAHQALLEAARGELRRFTVQAAVSRGDVAVYFHAVTDELEKIPSYISRRNKGKYIAPGHELRLDVVLPAGVFAELQELRALGEQFHLKFGHRCFECVFEGIRAGEPDGDDVPVQIDLGLLVEVKPF